VTPHFSFYARSPFGSAEAVRRTAALLGVRTVAGPDGVPRVEHDGLLLFTRGLTDEELGRIRGTLGFEPGVGLFFVDLTRDVPSGATWIARSVVRAAVSFRHEPSVHGVLLERLTRDGLVLQVSDGEVTVNSRWPGWAAWPDLDDAILARYRSAPLDLRELW
jgi:hypothetical protein